MNSALFKVISYGDPDRYCLWGGAVEGYTIPPGLDQDQLPYYKPALRRQPR